MPQDPLGRSKEIGALRKRMTKQLDVYGMYVDLDPKLEKRLAKAAEYSDFRRIENERQLEAIKSVLAGYIFNENVIVQGTAPDSDGTRVVSLSHFDSMLKAMNMFLSAMNMQNKIWGLYMVPTAPNGDSSPPPKNLSAALISEMRKLAIKDKLALPAGESQPIDKGTPDSDSRGAVTG